MLRNGRLFYAQSGDDLSHRALFEREVVQDLPPPGLRHGIESIRRGGSSWHESKYIFLYGNMSSALSPK
jgi:hypothetical protein